MGVFRPSDQVWTLQTRLWSNATFPRRALVAAARLDAERHAVHRNIGQSGQLVTISTTCVTVIVGNPPYNVGQKRENENNPNRKYKEVNERIRATHAKDSKAANTNSLADMYVKFFRWAADRVHICDECVEVCNSVLEDHRAQNSASALRAVAY